MDLNHRDARRSVWIKSLLYMLIVGGVHFVGLPALLLTWERGARSLSSRRRSAWICGLLLILVGAALALVSGHYLVTRGRGTPFPLEPTQALVTTGPYRHVRNPQAIAAMLIITGEVLIIRSRVLWVLIPLTVLYLEGLARPLEDRQLWRFGGQYAAYKQAVPRWLPHWWRW